MNTQADTVLDRLVQLAVMEHPDLKEFFVQLSPTTFKLFEEQLTTFLQAGMTASWNQGSPLNTYGITAVSNAGRTFYVQAGPADIWGPMKRF